MFKIKSGKCNNPCDPPDEQKLSPRAPILERNMNLDGRAVF
jgi:hypothetical protein